MKTQNQKSREENHILNSRNLVIMDKYGGREQGGQGWSWSLAYRILESIKFGAHL